MDGFAGSLDDSISAASTSDVQDRLSALELRVQQQEDEITVLKAALADVLRRLAISEDHTASLKKIPPGKAPAVLREALSMSCIPNGGGLIRKPTHGSMSVARKETFSSLAKSGTEKKKEKLQEVKETKEESESNDHGHQNQQNQTSPCPPQAPQTQRHTPESKSSAPAKRFSPNQIHRARLGCSDSNSIHSGHSDRLVFICIYN